MNAQTPQELHTRWAEVMSAGDLEGLDTRLESKGD